MTATRNKPTLPTPLRAVWAYVAADMTMHITIAASRADTISPLGAGVIAAGGTYAAIKFASHLLGEVDQVQRLKTMEPEWQKTFSRASKAFLLAAPLLTGVANGVFHADELKRDALPTLDPNTHHITQVNYARAYCENSNKNHHFVKHEGREYVLYCTPK